DAYGGANNGSLLRFDAVRGNTYQIAVDGLFGSSGRIVLRIFPTPPPANDNFGNRIVINGTPAQMVGNNVNATSEAAESNPFQNSPSKTVWWSWVAPASGIVIIDTSGSSFDTLLAIYTG